jgi:hypothetical protein
MSQKDYISPIPKVWHEIHVTLERYWKNELESKGERPPIPLILSGWNFASDIEKSTRWRATVMWAAKSNCAHLIKELNDEEKYFREN